MKKWIKRGLAALLVVVLALVAVGAWGYHLKGRVPDWYPTKSMDPEAVAAAARRVEDKFAVLRGWSTDTNGVERAQASGRAPVPTDPTGPLPASQTISLTEAELNAFFAKWDKQQRWADKYSAYTTDPVMVLQDGRIILAGHVVDADTLLSIHIQPSLDDKGKLKLEVARVMTGVLPLPQAFWDRYRQKLMTVVEDKAERSRKKVKLNADGSMNADAVTVAMNELLAHSLKGESYEPVLFLPHDTSQMSHGFPVKVTAVTVKDKTLSLTVLPLTRAEREEMVRRLREGEKTDKVAAGDASRAAASGLAAAPAPAPKAE